MVGIELQMNDTSSFFRYFKGRCHGNQFSGKMGQNNLPPALSALPFRNGMRYHNRSMRVNSVNDVSILCENFIKFGPVTPEFTMLTTPFAAIRKKTGPILTFFTGLVGVVVEIIIPIFI